MLLKTGVRLAFCAAVICLMLASCGGGGGGSATVSNPDGPPTSSHEIRTLVQGVLDDSDTLLMTEQHVVNAGDSPNFTLFRGIKTNCRGGACSGVILGEGTVRLSDLGPDDEMSPFLIRGGQPIVTGLSETSAQGVTAETRSFGSWMEHNAFWVSGTNFFEGSNQTGLLIGAMSFGEGTGTRPVSGSASWSGIMVGVQEDTFHDVHGDARVTVDFPSAKARVAFTDIVNADTGARLRSMGWVSLDITADGKFASARHPVDGHTLVGTFYGPNHEEVGGVFERDSIAGAFGASRN